MSKRTIKQPGIRYQTFPRSMPIPDFLQKVVECFERRHSVIDSNLHDLTSNAVLKIVEEDLCAIGYKVEHGKHKANKNEVPVLFGFNNKPEKQFDADAVSYLDHSVIEVEAGRACDNNQFLKDIFQASMMFGIDYLTIAVRNKYRGNDDFQKVYAFLETLYVNGRLKLPLKNILIIGY